MPFSYIILKDGHRRAISLEKAQHLQDVLQGKKQPTAAQKTFLERLQKVVITSGRHTATNTEPDYWWKNI